MALTNGLEVKVKLKQKSSSNEENWRKTFWSGWLG